MRSDVSDRAECRCGQQWLVNKYLYLFAFWKLKAREKNERFIKKCQHDLISTSESLISFANSLRCRAIRCWFLQQWRWSCAKAARNSWRLCNGFGLASESQLPEDQSSGAWHLNGVAVSIGSMDNGRMNSDDNAVKTIFGTTKRCLALLFCCWMN